MSYKTELQSNNTDIQTIEKYIDEFGSLIAGQDNLIAQIQTALEGKAIVSSGEASVNDIGVFTCESYLTNIKFLFIKGMTFDEFCSSKMNTLRYYKDGYSVIMYNYGNDIVVELDNGSWAFEAMISSDGINPCTPNTVIEEIDYLVIQ